MGVDKMVNEMGGKSERTASGEGLAIRRRGGKKWKGVE